VGNEKAFRKPTHFRVAAFSNQQAHVTHGKGPNPPLVGPLPLYYSALPLRRSSAICSSLLAEMQRCSQHGKRDFPQEVGSRWLIAGLSVLEGSQEALTRAEFKQSSCAPLPLSISPRLKEQHHNQPSTSTRGHQPLLKRWEGSPTIGTVYTRKVDQKHVKFSSTSLCVKARLTST
jgi:hypothetical protein